MTDDQQPHDAYPVDVNIRYRERSSRLLALLALVFFSKLLLLLPHWIIGSVLGLVSIVLALVGWLVELLTGNYPRGLFNFQVGVLRYSTRLDAWFIGLVDEYPPFRIYS